MEDASAPGEQPRRPQPRSRRKQRAGRREETKKPSPGEYNLMNQLELHARLGSYRPYHWAVSDTLRYFMGEEYRGAIFFLRGPPGGTSPGGLSLSLTLFHGWTTIPRASARSRTVEVSGAALKLSSPGFRNRGPAALHNVSFHAAIRDPATRQKALHF